MDKFKPRMTKLTPAFLIALGCLSIWGLAGCKNEAEKPAILAQVGNATLTLAELRESFPVEFEQLIRRDQYLDFIKRWIDDEVVYQQAQKAGLDKDSAVARKLAKVRRKLLIEEYLARENTADVFEPDEMAMSQYYEMHKEEFRLKVPEVKFIHIRAQTAKEAADLRSKALRGDFLAIAAASSLDPAPESYASISFKKQTEFPPCLAQEISGTGIYNVSQPITCSDGVYLVKVLERQEAGSLVPFSEAKEEISGILIMDRKDKLLENRIAKYKEGLTIGYNLDQVPGQVDTPKVAETQPAAPAAAPDTAPAAAAVKTAPAPATPKAPAPAAPKPVAAKPVPTPTQPANAVPATATAPAPAVHKPATVRIPVAPSANPAAPSAKTDTTSPKSAGAVAGPKAVVPAPIPATPPAAVP